MAGAQGKWSRREELLVGLLLRMTLCPSGLLKSMHKEQKRLVLRSGVSVLFATADPVLQGLSIGAVQLAFLVLGVLALSYGAATTITMNSVGLFAYQHVRFTTLQSRNGSIAAVTPGIATFGILQAFGKRQDSCMGRTLGSTYEEQGASLLLSLPAKEQAVGWYLIAHEEGVIPEGSMPARFKVEGSDDLAEWHIVGSSEFLPLSGRNIFLDGVREPPVSPGEYIHYDMRTPWPLRLGFNIPLFVYGGGVLMAAVVGFLGQAKWAKAWFFTALFGTAASSCFGAAGAYSLGFNFHALSFLLDALLEGVVLGVGLLAFASWFDIIILAAGLLRFAKVGLLETESLKDSQIVLVLPMVHTFFGLVFVIGRHVGVVRALLLVRGDKARFEAAFSSLLSQPGTRLQLESIQEVIARLHESFPNAHRPPRQLHRLDDPTAALGSMRRFQASFTTISQLFSSRSSRRPSMPANQKGAGQGLKSMYSHSSRVFPYDGPELSPTPMPAFAVSPSMAHLKDSQNDSAPRSASTLSISLQSSEIQSQSDEKRTARDRGDACPSSEVSRGSVSGGGSAVTAAGYGSQVGSQHSGNMLSRGGSVASHASQVVSSSGESHAQVSHQSSTTPSQVEIGEFKGHGTSEEDGRGVARSRGGSSNSLYSTEGAELFLKTRGSSISSFKGMPDARRQDCMLAQDEPSDGEGDTGRGVFERRGFPRITNNDTIPESPAHKDYDTPQPSKDSVSPAGVADLAHDFPSLPISDFSPQPLAATGNSRSRGPKTLLPPPIRISGFESPTRNSMAFDKQSMKARSPARRGGLPHEAASIPRSPGKRGSSRRGPPPSPAENWLPTSPKRQNRVWAQTQESTRETSPGSPTRPLSLGLGRQDRLWARRTSLAQVNFNQTMDPDQSPTMAPRQSVEEMLASIDELDERTHFGPCCGEEFTTNPMHPITSLDHLFNQACVAHHLLLDKAYSLAKQTDGKFPVRDGGFALKVSSSEDFRFGAVKSVHRCMAKVLMSYGGDASRLCDICRQILVYDDLAGIATCLSILLHDPSVEVVRVKDRMATNMTAKWLFAGYRFVAVNLRLRTEEAGSLCIDNHVVELILVHSAFQKLQTPKAHERYVTFRSMRTSMKRAVAVSLLYMILQMFPHVDKEDEAQAHDAAAVPQDTVIHVGNDKNRETGQKYEKEGTVIHAPIDRKMMNDIEISDVTDGREEEDTKTKVVEHSKEESWDGTSGLPEWISKDQEVIAGGRVRSGEGKTGYADFGEDLQDVLEYYARVATSGLSTFFDLSWQETSDAGSQGASAGSVAFFSSRPVVAAMQKTPFTIIVVLFAGASCFAVVNSIGYLNDWPIYEHYRFTPIQTKSGKLGNISVAKSISSFGIIDMLGCPASNTTRPLNFRSPVYDVSRSLGRHHVLSYDEPTLARGWFLKTSTEAGTQDQDPVRFVVHGSNDLSSWFLMGRPKWLAFSVFPGRIRHGYALFLDAVENFQNRDEIIVYDPGANLGWILYRLVSKSWLFTGLMVSALLGWFRKGYASRYALIATMLGSLFFMLWSTGYYLIFGLFENAIEVCVASIAFFFMSLGLIFERWFLGLLAIGGAVDMSTTLLAWSIARASLAPDSEGFSFLQVVESFVGVCIYVLMGVVFVLRWRALRTAKRVIQDDKARYDALWDEVMACDTGCIQNLKNVIRMVGLDSKSTCRQYQRKLGVRGRIREGLRQQPPDLLLDSLGICTLPGSIDTNRPVTSLDQLYACASVVNAVVLEKVQEWALSANGMFPLRNEAGMSDPDSRPEFARWADVKGTPTEERVRWSFLKKFNRASEKIIRSHASDPSYLLDICRHQIIFERPQDLTMCLGQIVLDDEIRIQRIKNRLSDAYDSSVTAGYRDVAVNFCVVNEATMALGVEMHVVEIQLVLESFAQFRGMSGHKRYISFRNARGE